MKCGCEPSGVETPGGERIRPGTIRDDGSRADLHQETFR